MTPTDRACHAAAALADAAGQYHGTQRVLSPRPARHRRRMVRLLSWLAAADGTHPDEVARCPRRGAGRGLQGCQQDHRGPSACDRGLAGGRQRAPQGGCMNARELVHVCPLCRVFDPSWFAHRRECPSPAVPAPSCDPPWLLPLATPCARGP